MPDALEGLTDRERAIFEAGQHAGAAQVLAQVAEQHAVFVRSAKEQIAARYAASTQALEELPVEKSLGTRAGDALGKRVVAVGKALLAPK